MKKLLITLLLTVAIIIVPTQRSHAIVWVVVKAAIKKVIIAIDLGIQRQQNKVIWLQNAQKTLENYMSKLKLDEISDWSEKQKAQYQKYFDELRQVKLLISYYQRIKDITQKETRIINEYKHAWNLIKNDSHFTAKELDYMEKVYNGILNETVKNIDQLAMVINSMQTQMADEKRLEIIDKTSDKVDENYMDLLLFNRQNAMLSLQRASDEADIARVKFIYGLQ
ncbi:conjugal transfer protein TraI [Chitinophaga sancti]|uniref:conjugal transfer protein TraI n=1 Tax=Chitinophaga sancti TaxID=1004 RepID=UPI002A75485C|nr:conjugal transfer protein TraI [Chitinophaga sancti]WPQ61929.1 conjugal transfer protein TraI [Chitinophaga sancti]